MLLPPRKVTLLVVGLDNAGKSSVIMDIGRGEEADFCWGGSHKECGGGRLCSLAPSVPVGCSG